MLFSSYCYTVDDVGLLESYPFKKIKTFATSFFLLRQLTLKKAKPIILLMVFPYHQGYLLIDSLFDFPVNRPWLVYDEWFQTYGKYKYFMIKFN